MIDVGGFAVMERRKSVLHHCVFLWVLKRHQDVLLRQGFEQTMQVVKQLAGFNAYPVFG